MTQSVVSICNQALIHLGDEVITALTENSTRARMCNHVYEASRDFALAAHPWNCAIVRTGLAALTDTPEWGWAHQFTLPTDPYCLRVVEVMGLDNAEWVVEGRNLLCDVTPVKIRYIQRLTDPAQFSPQLAEAIACKLAHKIAYKLTGSRTTEREMRDLYNATVKEARGTDGLEGAPPVVESDWLEEHRL